MNNSYAQILALLADKLKERSLNEPEQYWLLTTLLHIEVNRSQKNQEQSTKDEGDGEL